MTQLEVLQDYCYEKGLDVVEMKWMPNKKVHGLCSDKLIILDKNLDPKDKICILSEEIAHYQVNTSNILDQKKISNQKEEHKARRVSYEKLLPLHRFVDAFNAGVTNLFELSEFLELSEEFITSTLEFYKNKYGLYKDLGDVVLYFEPLGVFEKKGGS